MIVQLTGNVKFPITLDPSVWIFDDRKVEFDQAFQSSDVEQDVEDENEKASKRWNREVYQQKINPPVNKSISRFERKKILQSTYVMSLKPFLENAEVSDSASSAILVTNNGNQEISLDTLKEGFALFAVEGKPLKEDGPLHFYFGDESNKDTPIKGVSEIKIK
ncbi:hypothetical protein [Salinibacillus xinjiangensis]|uniref:Peptidyl-prolyl cis-trans isomerase n=1 Tax=Salinibacillus xinjiangensis TaxID=1229268 RepID=A0A6G1X3P3_9BACI|nr:hypothetical protein [Salinibacillus xinjiangensis]MRG85539.1 hypothetical protein [Salinibacillus xinjiangensis]